MFGIGKNKQQNLAEVKKDLNNITVVNIEDKKNIWVSEEINPSTIYTAILYKDSYGKLQKINKLFDLLIDYNDNIAGNIDVRSEALKSKLPTIKNDLPDKQREFYDDLIENKYSDLVDIVIERKMKGFVIRQVEWEIINGLYYPKSFINYQNQDLRNIHKKLEFYIEDKLQTLSEYKFIMELQNRSILQPLLKYYSFFKFAINNWASFIEIFGKPIRVGKYKPGATKKEKDELWEMLQKSGSDLAAMISENVVMEFIEYKNQRGSAELYDTMVKFIETRETKRILGQTLTTTAEKTGSFAQSKIHNLVRKDILAGDARDTVHFLNAFFSKLHSLNFSADKIKTSIDITDDVNLFERVQIDRTLQNDIGIEFPDDYFHKLYKVPKP